VLKAIETQYKGYRFRSRLEARWAVFFDALGLRWEYEPEGFELGGAVRYLPDFWLPIQDSVMGFPGCGHWVEIKPIAPTEVELKKVQELALQSGHSALLFAGVPGEHTTYLVYRTEGRVIVREGALPEFSNGEYYVLRAGVPLANCLIGYTWSEQRGAALVAEAIAEARGARFEFGENGARRDDLAEFEALRR
jgi:hypothetical protein